MTFQQLEQYFIDDTAGWKSHEIDEKTRYPICYKLLVC